MLGPKYNNSTAAKLSVKHARSRGSGGCSSHNFQAVSGLLISLTNDFTSFQFIV